MTLAALRGLISLLVFSNVQIWIALGEKVSVQPMVTANDAEGVCLMQQTGKLVASNRGLDNLAEHDEEDKATDDSERMLLTSRLDSEAYRRRRSSSYSSSYRRRRSSSSTKCSSYTQKRYSAWCDSAVGTYDLNGVKTRSTWCRSKSKVSEKCNSASDFNYCFQAYFGCTAKKSDAERCCVQPAATTTPPTTATPTVPATTLPATKAPATKVPAAAPTVPAKTVPTTTAPATTAPATKVPATKSVPATTQAPATKVPAMATKDDVAQLRSDMQVKIDTLAQKVEALESK